MQNNKLGVFKNIYLSLKIKYMFTNENNKLMIKGNLIFFIIFLVGFFTNLMLGNDGLLIDDLVIRVINLLPLYLGIYILFIWFVTFINRWKWYIKTFIVLLTLVLLYVFFWMFMILLLFSEHGKSVTINESLDVYITEVNGFMDSGSFGYNLYEIHGYVFLDHLYESQFDEAESIEIHTDGFSNQFEIVITYRYKTVIHLYEDIEGDVVYVEERVIENTNQ